VTIKELEKEKSQIEKNKLLNIEINKKGFVVDLFIPQNESGNSTLNMKIIWIYKYF